ncbi:dynamin family protein [Actinoplanes derwentensis]|uniref:Dynamin family protein n=1 Tax=Actinoplanes derwentensis TaxID=113562 RepID=A0A1H1WDP7_9ACTN|nr:dynamin family protein [Actinoplanes derwentensis]GID87394.1 dynamin [Actinoplanes derwentensis]SDS95144.1 Dynamin family protein [Actinoplanes derwentensis]
MQDLTALLDDAVRDTVSYLRTADPDAAADLVELRRAHLTRPGVVVVGETKRGKSSLINALLGVPGLSPVDAAVTTAAYLSFVPGSVFSARAWLPGGAEIEIDSLDEWARGKQRTRKIEVTHPAPLLQYLTLLDTPGAGGLDPVHATIALDAVRRATALLFVADASAPLSQPELDFLAAATERVDAVVFALTKIDAYPQWRTIAEDNRSLLQAHAPRFAAAPWFPVSARLAEIALTADPATRDTLAAESKVPDLQHALVELAGRGHQLRLANVLRAAHRDLTRLRDAGDQRVKASAADPAAQAATRAERAALAARKRTESRQWTLRLNTEIQHARVAVVGHLRTRITEVQHDYARRIDTAGSEALSALPDELDTQLQAVAAQMSATLEDTYRDVAEKVLADTFDPALVSATLRHTMTAGPPRDGAGDNVLIALSAGGIALIAGRGAMIGLSAVAGAGFLIPFAGLGLGLAAGGYVIYRRRVHTDRRHAHTWLRDVLGEARAALTDEISGRFTDLQYSLAVALDDAIERRLRELDALIAEIDAAAAEDAAGRAKRRAAATTDRDAAAARLRQADEALLRARSLTPAPIDEGLR